MTWATTSAKTETAPRKTFGVEHYRQLFDRKREAMAPIRMALVGKENTAKTGLALDLALSHTDKEVVIIDCDNSAQNTVDYLISTGAADADRIRVIPIIDELDDAMWNDDNTTNWMAVVDKIEWFASFLGESSDNVGAVIFDGGSTFLKWCEFVMTDRLIRRGVINDSGDGFNQKEWRERNSVFKGVLDRLTALPIPYIFYTFHLKDQKQYMDIGDGTKALMKVGEKVDWVDGTQRFVSQQVWLRRYTKKGDKAAGVEADKALADDEFAIRAKIEEMKGRNMEHLGTTHEVLNVKDSKVTWNGLPLRWSD
ncbi:MAG: hypothetical protein Unbinned2404contig1000_44 [Prokaryotic dsDNA virus sp.]|nr:MAG: hypothetical protein Unbinned2404contig1000_44 [Prokaryotic dsDNA virus sp.]|tara:strand:- start:8054 stop:8983 length:930 start_codon:yes stop_codon:yes gene_type:complete